MTSPWASAEIYPDLPPSGAGAVAPLFRRIVAILVDWMLCQLIAVGLLGMKWGQVSGNESFYPLAVLFVENAILVPTLGATLGHRLLGVKVVRLDAAGLMAAGGIAADRPGAAGLPSLGRSVLRAFLLCLAIPPLVMDSRLRGLHDKAAGTVVVRSR